MMLRQGMLICFVANFLKLALQPE